MLILKNIKKQFQLGDEVINAVDDVSLHVKKGEYVAIVGPSGSGKSTLMNIIGLLDVPDSGTYELDGIDISKSTDDELSELRNKKIGFIFQNFNLLTKLTAIENIKIPLMYRGYNDKESEKIAMEMLKKVGLENRRNHLPSQLSGGQQQRIAIARALSCNPEIILADEPTGALDSKTSIEIMNKLEELNKNGQTIVLITHDNSIAARAKRIVRISDGKLYEEKNNEQV